MADTVIFDMDGVVVDSELYWGKPDFNFLRSLIPGWDMNKHMKRTGISIYDIHESLKPEFSVSIKKSEFLNKYHRLAEEIYGKKSLLLPGFLEFIRSLKREGFKTAIVSSSPRSWIDIVMKRFGIANLFDRIVSADGFKGRGKPAPDIYLHAAGELGVNPGDCVVIEDSENGVASAKAAGMKCIGFRGKNKTGVQELSRADFVVDGFSELSPHRIRKLLNS
jgi:HAD superfamily hydrolase (TIGR01509 family)